MDPVYVLVEIEELSKRLAGKQFREEIEEEYDWDDIYEQIDETGNWYMKDVWSSVLSTMELEWKKYLFSVENHLLTPEKVELLN